MFTISPKENLEVLDYYRKKFGMNSKGQILLGKRFDRYLVIDFGGRGTNNNIMWKCRCDCGTIRNVAGTTLNSWHTTSCGCKRADMMTKTKSKHGGSETPEYKIWIQIKNKHLKQFVGMDQRWKNSFEEFIKDVGKRPSPDYNLCRINGPEGYYKNNMEWRANNQNTEDARYRKKFGLGRDAKILMHRVFGNLTVENYGGKNHVGQVCWLCRCSCGNPELISVIGTNLLREVGGTKSCGCIHINRMSDRATHRMSDSPEYQAWRNMIARCNNPNHEAYKNYGGRGIKVLWNSFEEFYADMGDRPSSDLSIERVNNDDVYWNHNVIWATAIEQARNQRVQTNNNTGYAGISIRNGKYEVAISLNKKINHLGVFSILNDAIDARIAGELKYWGRQYTFKKVLTPTELRDQAMARIMNKSSDETIANDIINTISNIKLPTMQIETGIKSDNKSKSNREPGYVNANKETHTTWMSFKQKAKMRGIEVDKRWKEDFLTFLSDMGPKPSPDHSFRRMDTKIGYFKHNCEWKINDTNKELSKYDAYLEVNGERIVVNDKMREEFRNKLSLSKDVKIVLGIQFDKLHVTDYFGRNDKRRTHLWVCECECKNTINVEVAALINGHTKSCGCTKINKLIDMNKTRDYPKRK